MYPHVQMSIGCGHPLSPIPRLVQGEGIAKDTDDVFTTSRTVCHDQVCGTSFRVVRVKTLMIDGCDCDGIDTVCVAVKVTLVFMGCAIPASVNKNGAFPATTIGDTIDDGLFNEIARCLHRFSVIGRSPAAAVDGSFLEAEVERRGLINVGNRPRQYPNASDFGVPGNTHTACIILNSTDLTCTASSVVVIKQFGSREVFMVVEIVRAFSPLFLHPC